MSSTAALSPAKINLLLKVLRKRDDGFHELFSVMQPVTLYDNISVEAGEGGGITLECHNADIPSDHTNLAYRAAKLLLEKAGLKKRVNIVIDKKIPVGAGLGGGSSNAATVLMTLNTLLNTGLSEAELVEMGVSLGSDVPFFILRGPALARGRGEILERIALPPCHYILINPGFPVPTAWVYGNLDLTKSPEDNNLTYSVKAFERCVDIKGMLKNDLEPVTASRHPEISRLKALLIENGAVGALMSGSGPTVFGLFPDHGRARRAFEAIRPLLGGKSTIFLVQGIEGRGGAVGGG
ncbi:MAG: 4-(cytidine 5'-diphospho)-2-C-methyl-D-erythritol kinase [Deltaproteobacteria bacterium]|nr:4-(cytidine 5'-diphospho)-2-C-methyl-D-erythritol kinase [Deltaproteobacteria bacterium]